MGNYISCGDMAVSVCALTEHTAPHMVQNNGMIWSEMRSYNYINSVKVSYFSETEEDKGYEDISEYRSEHTNNPYILNAQTTSAINTNVSGWKKAINYISGIFNNKLKYSGTFNKVLHAGLLPTTQDYQNFEAYTAAWEFDLRPSVLEIDEDGNDNGGSRIKTMNHGCTHNKVVVWIVEGIIILAVTITAATTGNIWLLFAAALLTTMLYQDGLIVCQGIEGNPSLLYKFMNQLDFSFH